MVPALPIASKQMVPGAYWPELLDLARRGVLRHGEPYATLDVRTLYLKALTLYGNTFQCDVVFENPVGYTEQDEIRPLMVETFLLGEIAAAQTEFMEKRSVGKLVLLQPE